MKPGMMIAVGRAADVPPLEGRSVLVAGRRVAIFRAAHGWRALGGTCPHAGGPLADGIVSERCVTCPLHGWRFDLDTGEALNAQAQVETYEVLERGGELWLRVPHAQATESAPVIEQAA